MDNKELYRSNPVQSVKSLPAAGRRVQLARLLLLDTQEKREFPITNFQCPILK
jgi:hypothetical protein